MMNKVADFLERDAGYTVVGLVLVGLGIAVKALSIADGEVLGTGIGLIVARRGQAALASRARRASQETATAKK